jgi:hypothetical protein
MNTMPIVCSPFQLLNQLNRFIELDVDVMAAGGCSKVTLFNFLVSNPLQLLNQLIEFHKTWYRCDAVGGHSNTFHFL